MHDYWMPWRPVYEGYAVAGWLLAALISFAFAVTAVAPPGPLLTATTISLVMAAWRALPAWRLWCWQRRLCGQGVDTITPARLAEQTRRRPDATWLGQGFEWTPEHAQRIHEVLAPPGDRRRWAGTATAGTLDVPWLHGVGGLREQDLWLPLAHQGGHTLLGGTTGSFKTSLLILIIAQAILRGEPVIVLDPKGDRGLRQAIQAACRQAGRERDFVYFHPAFPERSARLDPLFNWANATEVPSRVATLIPSETGSDPFKAFSWDALNNIVVGLLKLEERPNLLKLRRYVVGGPEELLRAALERYGERCLPDYSARVMPYLKGAGHDPARQLAGWIRFYWEVLRPRRPSVGLEGLIAMVEHDRVHFGKMVASLIPVLGMLTSPPLDGLLSPDPADGNDPCPLTDMARMLDHDQVAYIGLDALANNMVASAIGSMLTADFAATLGARYNYDQRLKPFTLIVDEVAEVVNERLVQILNKARGAGARLVLATQTLADLEARLGSPALARMVLGNVNNLIARRLRDLKTQEYITESLVKTRIRLLTPAQSAISGATHPLAFSGGYQESLTQEEAALFAPEWLGLLPNLEYIALLSGSRILKGRLPVLVLEGPVPEVEAPPSLDRL